MKVLGREQEVVLRCHQVADLVVHHPDPRDDDCGGVVRPTATVQQHIGNVSVGVHHRRNGVLPPPKYLESTKPNFWNLPAKI